MTPRRCYATLSSAGWYRVMDVAVANANASKFSVATIVDINIGTEYWANSNGTHKISLHGVFNNVAFLGEESKSNNMLVSKVRYTYDSSGNGHIDIYYTGTSGNPVWCTFAVHAPYSYQHWFVANSFTAVGPSPANETVLAEYSFSSNYGNGGLCRILTSSDDLNDLTEQKDAGLYMISSGVQNAPISWAALLNISAGSYGTHQFVFNNNSAYQRSKTGTPLTWTAWTKTI